jgi:hypothetical protein
MARASDDDRVSSNADWGARQMQQSLSRLDGRSSIAAEQRVLAIHCAISAISA